MNRALPWFVVIAMVLAAGCATVPYRHGQNLEQPDTLRLRPGEVQVVRGRPNEFLDSVGWLLGIPSKIILWNSRVDNHRISTNTQVALERYLATNDLNQVKVRINQWDPKGEWSRLFRNKSVGWGWRYTIGILSTAFYTILPGRLLGGDNYNPYTDTINIYSDVPAILLHEGGHAKDLAQREWKGTYSFCTMWPLINLYPEAKASGDAIGYLRVEGTAEEEKAAYKILYPAYGTYLGGGIGEIAVPAAPALYIGGVIGGHIAGRVKATGVDERRASTVTGDP